MSKTDDIPEDYDGVMGVPVTFLTKCCPEQFEIVKFRKGNDEKDLTYTIEDEQLPAKKRKVAPFFRILIRHKRAGG